MLVRAALPALLYLSTVYSKDDDLVVPAVRVVRLQIEYPNAAVKDIQKIHKWNPILRNSVIASLRFINKHWLICGSGPNGERPANDCGKAQVTGEVVGDDHYRINATFISERDPIKNVKVEATSTVMAVSQIGLKGGIFQYTNALKLMLHNSAVYKRKLECTVRRGVNPVFLKELSISLNFVHEVITRRMSVYSLSTTLPPPTPH
ncbi:unnamed protein product [Strongylus vulgaris]|uniref:Uncharacterized protein n=1 Tax=Strongylus vulgaris TaxID=40348 RepID=A0A3P7ING6_STRVU|nr:unnamed protein product [Strongylus vulgaris]